MSVSAMQRETKQKKDFQHGQLIDSMILKVIFLKGKQAILIDDKNTFQSVDIRTLEMNKTFELKNVVIEKKNNFSFNYSLHETKETKVIKSRKNLKHQFIKSFESFGQAKPGKVTNLKCLIIEQQELDLKLFDGNLFKLKLRKDLDIQSKKLEILFVKKSHSHNFVWETELTQFEAGNENDPFWKTLHVPQIEVHSNPEDIKKDAVGKWSAMLTTAMAPFTYGKDSFMFLFLDAAPNSPKKVRKLDDGKFKNDRTGEIFQECKQEMRLCFKASNGKNTVTCICFTKVASAILNVQPEIFAIMNDNEQRSVIKNILYETKLLTLKNQGENFLLLNVEDVQETIKRKGN